MFSSWYIVDQGERAVVLRLGATVGEAGPGPHFKVPWVDTVRKITVQNQNRRYQALEAYSRDQQPANLTVSVTFVVSDRERRSTSSTAISKAPSCGSSIRA